MKNFIETEIESYCISKSSLPSKHCEAIFKYTQKYVPMSQMLIGPFEASLLGFLMKQSNARKILEIGCFTGYSALAMAERLPKEGTLVTLEINKESAAIAERFWKESPHGHKIKLILGEASDSLKRLKTSFDFVFIDADKENYIHYLDQILPLLSPQGIIAADNCLWGGEVLNHRTQDQVAKAIIAFNNYVSKRRDLEFILIPIRDGIFLIRKK